MKQILRLSSILFLAHLLSACSGGGGGGGGAPQGPQGPGGDEVLASCDSVVTEEKVKAFNGSQTQYQIRQYGSTVTCSAEVEVNGQKRRVEAKGSSGLILLPNLQFVSFEGRRQDSSYLLKYKLLPITDEAKTSILAALKISLDGRKLSEVVVTSESQPSYIRFGKSDLHTVEREFVQDMKAEDYYIQIDPDDQYRQEIQDKVSQFTSGGIGAELLWYPQNGMISMTALDASSFQWQLVDGATVIHSTVKESARNKYFLYSQALDNVYFWKVNPSSVHTLLPELYTYAAEEWQNPSIADNNVNNLHYALEYLVAINPKSHLKLVLDSFKTIYEMHDRKTEALEYALTYATKNTPSKGNFETLVATAKALYPSLGSKSWTLAQAIASRKNYELKECLFVAKVAMLMYKLDSSSIRNGDVVPVFEKINKGINPSNVDLYFSVFEYFRNKLSASLIDAEAATDAFVLTGKMTTENQDTYLGFLAWLKNSEYLGFTDAVSILKTITQQTTLTPGLVEYYKSVTTWLRGQVYLGREEAALKASRFVSIPGFNESRFSLLKEYYGYLTGTIYLSRENSLARAESALVEKAATNEQIEHLKGLTDWYKNKMYVNREDSLKKAELMVLDEKLSKTATEVMRAAATWLNGSLYLSREASIAKAETYMREKQLSQAKLNQLMAETESFQRQGKSREEALRLAEAKVLP